MQLASTASTAPLFTAIPHHRNPIPHIPYRENDAIVMAACVIMCWGSTLTCALFKWDTRQHAWWASLLLAVALEYLYAGLFVTGHDAWHGSISRNPQLNALIGRIALICHGWFDFDRLAYIHRQHHAHHGIPEQDPDIHDHAQGMLEWFIAMAFDYATPLQLLYIAAELCTLVLVFQVLIINIVLFLVLPMAVSTFRLFFFLTYIPHNPRGKGPWRDIRTFTGHPIIATLLCFNAVYHSEHHAAPYLPWFVLPQAVSRC